ncbi:hypothetical protein [Nonomuraea sp. bgisy101]|uniref:hypothetical protein n=1 Tax=Nonomuraea sp. bgisy101 TaxID=3413784 RepID=UPI003D73D76C
MELIDRLIPIRVRLLMLLNDPPGWFDQHPGPTRPQGGAASVTSADGRSRPRRSMVRSMAEA